MSMEIAVFGPMIMPCQTAFLHLRSAAVTLCHSARSVERCNATNHSKRILILSQWVSEQFHGGTTLHLAHVAKRRRQLPAPGRDAGHPHPRKHGEAGQDRECRGCQAVHERRRKSPQQHVPGLRPVCDFFRLRRCTRTNVISNHCTCTDNRAAHISCRRRQRLRPHLQALKMQSLTGLCFGDWHDRQSDSAMRTCHAPSFSEKGGSPFHVDKVQEVSARARLLQLLMSSKHASSKLLHLSIIKVFFLGTRT